MVDFLIMKQMEDAVSGPMYVIHTKSGREIAHLFKVNDKWTVWSGDGYFNGLGRYPHPTLSALLVWLLAVVQVPIIITGGKTNGETGSNKKSAA